MRYLLHGATLALAWFLATNLLLSAAVVAASAWAGAGGISLGRGSASRLLLLRLLPSAASVLFVACVFIPSYWKFEPRETEGFDLTLTLAAAAACAVIAAAALRGAIAWWRAIKRARAWTQMARPLALDGVGIPAFQVEADSAGHGARRDRALAAPRDAGAHRRAHARGACGQHRPRGRASSRVGQPEASRDARCAGSPRLDAGRSPPRARVGRRRRAHRGRIGRG